MSMVKDDLRSHSQKDIFQWPICQVLKHGCKCVNDFFMYPLLLMERLKSCWPDLLSFVELWLAITSDTFLMKCWGISWYMVVIFEYTSSSFHSISSFTISCHMHIGFCSSIVPLGSSTVSMSVLIGGRDMGHGFSSQ